MPRVFFVLVPVLAVTLAMGCQMPSSSPSPLPTTGPGSLDARGGPPAKQFVEEVFIDHVRPVHAGPGPHPTSETDNYSLTQGGIRWMTSDNVTYWIRGTDPLGGAGSAALEAAVEVLDAYIAPTSFSSVTTTPSSNPCASPDDPTGGFNTLWWTPMDGPGGVLASTAACRNVATKEIVGFVVRFDSLDTWSVTGAANAIDVLNVAVHEMGHVAGLGHVNGGINGCLTMYTYSAEGETQKRTLGWGDKLGLVSLYGTNNTTAGTCGS